MPEKYCFLVCPNRTRSRRRLFGSTGKCIFTDAEATDERTMAAEEEVRPLRDELSKLQQPPQC
jgi:hypothetical protein